MLKSTVYRPSFLLLLLNFFVWVFPGSSLLNRKDSRKNIAYWFRLKSKNFEATEWKVEQIIIELRSVWVFRPRNSRLHDVNASMNKTTIEQSFDPCSTPLHSLWHHVPGLAIYQIEWFVKTSNFEELFSNYHPFPRPNSKLHSLLVSQTFGGKKFSFFVSFALNYHPSYPLLVNHVAVLFYKQNEN